MISEVFKCRNLELLEQMEADGLLKRERLIVGPQGGRIQLSQGTGKRQVVNLCANNYLGLADHPEIVAAAKRALDAYGFGMASVRFICGTQTLHRELERTIAHYLGKDDAILFAACFDANGGVFEPLLEAEDAIISDSLIRSDNGPEFIAKAVRDWITAVGAKTAFIEPSSPWENGTCESFNSKLRDELLNAEIFYSLAEARIVIESWRGHYNNKRPHSSLGYRPPAPAAVPWPAAPPQPASPATSNVASKPTTH